MTINIQKNKWVLENNKWVEYKSIQFSNGSKEYMNLLTKASKLPNTEIHFLINTLEDILFNRNYIKDERTEGETCQKK
tara:strand:- start:4466 stop:4699 length:234 start_codon:yes stop_codon:yes gene_type:complete